MYGKIKIILLSVIHGLTSALPVSSLGHYALLKEVLGCTDENFNASFYYGLFSIGAGLAMYIYYFTVHTKIIKNMFKRKKKLKTGAEIAFRTAGRNIILSMLPVALLFVPFSKGKFVFTLSDYFLSDGSVIYLGIAGLFGAILMFISVWYIKSEYSEKKNLVSPGSAIWFGIYQLPAYILPGISHIGMGASRAAVSDVDAKNILKEAYLYIAPAFMITGAARAVYYYNGGKGLYVSLGVIGAAVSFVLTIVVLAFINKFFSKRAYKAFAIYTLVFALIIIGTSLYAFLAQ